jgi:viroplasmin and RNaseH domain-containing protein
MKYYAVKVGKVTGIFTSWSECQDSINGFSNPVFKAFNTEEEAKAYLGGTDIYREKVLEDIKRGLLVAFCDGSFDEKIKKYAYGVIIIDKEGGEHELCGSASNPKYISSKNIMGEILGVVNSLDWAVSNGYSRIKIYHDLEGLAKWASGEFEAKSEVAKTYLALIEKYRNLVEIEFEKVKGHSNNCFNEKADALAKAALFEHKKLFIKGETWFTINLVSNLDLDAIVDLIKEEFPEIATEKIDTGTKVQYKLKLNNKKLSAILFNNGKHQLLVQGADSILFQIFVAYLLDLFGIDKVDYILKDAYRKTINKDQITKDFDVCFPIFPTDYPENVKKLIRQSIINLSYYIESEDYGQYAFPALRAIEGHLKYQFQINGTPIGSKSKLGDNFYLDSQAPPRFKLKPEIKLTNPQTVQHIEKCYNCFHRHRHTLFHFGDIIGQTDSSRMLENKEEADEIIKRCFEIISEAL